MSKIITWTPEQQLVWDEWVKSRPKVVQEIAIRLPPTELYRLKSSGHRCTIYSYSEDGTVTVDISGDYNRVLFSRHVFGIHPDDLEKCDFPLDGEDIGDTAKEAGYSEADIKNILIPQLKKKMNL